jgi:ribosomal protein S15P/S13E
MKSDLFMSQSFKLRERELFFITQQINTLKKQIEEKNIVNSQKLNYNIKIKKEIEDLTNKRYKILNYLKKNHSNVYKELLAKLDIYENKNI